MSDQLKKIDKQYDHLKLLDLYNSLNMESNQINFTTRGSDDMNDGVGSIFEYHPATEYCWNRIHPHFKGTYLEEVYNDLSGDWMLGRGRFMLMDDNNRALTWHYDTDYRLHIPLMTTEESWFILDDKNLHRMAELGSLYSLEASRYHAALNLSRTNKPRLHIVISAKPLISNTDYK